MVTVTKIFNFEACHKLPHYEGDCHNLHGHSYKLEVTLTGNIIEDRENPKCGMIIDFKDLKRIAGDVVGMYDHSYLNDYFPNPTAEIMVEKIAKDIIRRLPKGKHLVSCKLWETATSYAEYTPIMDELLKRVDSLERMLKFADAETMRPAT